MVNPLEALNALQDYIKKGSAPLEICQSDSRYHYVLDVVGGKNRFSCFEIRQGVIAAYVGLVNVGTEMGIQRFQIGYAVIEQERSKGLGAAIVNASITELLRVVRGFGIYQVYIEAVIALNNIHSINLSKKCINSEYEEIIDEYSGEEALYFITLRNTDN